MLDRGFALVTDQVGKPVKTSKAAPERATVTIRFSDAEREAQLDPDSAIASQPKNQKLELIKRKAIYSESRAGEPFPRLCGQSHWPGYCLIHVSNC